MGKLLTFLVGAFGSTVTSGVVKWIVFKGFMFTLFTFVLPTVLFKLMTKILSDTMAFATDTIASGGTQGIAIQMTSLGAWLAVTVGLPACFSLFLSAIALRYTLNLISPRV